MLGILRMITHVILPVKRKQYAFVRKHAKGLHNKKILEIGSGANYNVNRFFHESNEYIQTDLVASEGVRELDITQVSLKPDYDIIVCLNVLEHIFDYQSALDNIYQGLKKGGFLFLSIPLFYPLHMLPDDYWRFTPITIKKLLSKYTIHVLETNGLKRFPYNINILAEKKEI
jgi:SAM-dependent methyltransferase